MHGGDVMVEFDKYDMLQYELFEQLIPELLYHAEKEIRKLLLENLQSEYPGSVYDLFEKLCEDDQINCPYSESDFAVKYFEVGGIEFVEIAVPGTTNQINHCIRAYVLSAHERENPDEKHVRYFIIKKFRGNEGIYAMYVSPDGELQLGSDLTGRLEDRDYEYRAVGRDFIMVLSKELDFIEAEVRVDE